MFIPLVIVFPGTRQVAGLPPTVIALPFIAISLVLWVGPIASISRYPATTFCWVRTLACEPAAEATSTTLSATMHASSPARHPLIVMLCLHE
jgi:hypothetical protein